MKTLLAQSQRELISAIRSSSLENRTNFNDEVMHTPILLIPSPSQTVRFENVENAENVVAVRNTLFYF